MTRLLISSALVLCTTLTHAVASQGAPNWSVNPADFEFSATITAQVELDGVVRGAEEDLLAAFVDDELRGVVAPIPVLDTWMYFLTVYANKTGEAMVFRNYQASRDTVVDLEDAVLFRVSAVIGDPQEPLVLRGQLGIDEPTGIGAVDTPDQALENAVIPAAHALYQNYPNPFNGSTRIEYALATAQNIEVAIYNLAGQRVRHLFAEKRPAGRSSTSWDGRDDHGRILPSGVYVYALHGRYHTRARKLLLLR